jgi:hypothetical protein
VTPKRISTVERKRVPTSHVLKHLTSTLSSRRVPVVFIIYIVTTAIVKASLLEKTREIDWEADDVVFNLHDPAQVSSLGLGEPKQFTMTWRGMNGECT